LNSPNKNVNMTVAIRTHHSPHTDRAVREIRRKTMTKSARALKIHHKLSILAIALLLPLALGACDKPDDSDGPVSDVPYTIELSCQGTQTFKGNIMVTKADGQIEITDVEDLAPRSYSVKGVQVDCTFQKTSATGYLKVRILRAGKVLAEGETGAAYGTTWVTGR
jgi:hypothetical protein